MDCADKCAAWEVDNGKICEFWDYNKLDRECSFKKRGPGCTKPDLVQDDDIDVAVNYVVGTCPPSGSNCGISKTIQF